MIYRRTRPADRLDITRLAKDSGINYDGREPYFGLVAADEKTDKVIGCSYIHLGVVIEPFICKDPYPALKLFYETNGAISLLSSQMPISSTIIQIHADNKRLLDEVEKLGYERILAKYALFKKVI